MTAAERSPSQAANPQSSRVRVTTPADAGRRTQHLDDESFGTLVGELASDLQSLVRDELQLARVEVTREARQAGKSAGMLGAGAVTGLVAWVLLATSIAWAIAEAWPAWAGFAIVGIVHVLVAGVLAAKGRSRLQHVDPVPEQAVEEARTTQQWMKDQP